MSFPNIPNITPDIDITFEDAVNLLLISIALEEISISELLDAETKKILAILESCKHKHKHIALEEAKEINKSVDQTVKDLIKFQMLLQFKLENVIDILPKTTTTSTTTASTSSTTTTTRTTFTTTTHTTTTHTTTTTTHTTTTRTHTTTSTTLTCSSTTSKKCKCCFSGKGRGIVTNCVDEFYRKKALLYAFVNCCNVKDRSLRYDVKNDCDFLHMTAFGAAIKIECPNECPEELVVYGKGHAVKKSECQCAIEGAVKFKLTVCKSAEATEFKMEIESAYQPELNHDSGFVKVNNLDFCLKTGCC